MFEFNKPLLIALGAAWLFMFLFQISLRKDGHPVARFFFTIIKVLLAAAVAFFLVFLDNIVAYRWGYVLMALYIILMGDALSDVIALIIRFIPNYKKKKRRVGDVLLGPETMASSGAPMTAGEGNGEEEATVGAAGEAGPSFEVEKEASPVYSRSRRVRKAEMQEEKRSFIKKPLGPIRRGILSLLFCCLLFAYGTWNGSHVGVKKHNWQVDGLKSTHTFVFVSDLHTGQGQKKEAIEKMVEKINDAKPEFVVLGGDITDEFTTYEEMMDIYRVLGKIEAPTYFIYGNHDRQVKSALSGGRTYEDQQLEKEIKRAGITILQDQFVKISDDLVILGREDMSSDSRGHWNSLKNPYEGKGALIVMDHQPFDKNQTDSSNPPFQISGHTHAGQLWPLQLVYETVGLPTYGEKEMSGNILYVSAGAGDWEFAFRTEESCQWDLITIEPVEP